MGGRAGRVLVVEDDSLIRRALSRLLVNWGYEAVEAADGRAALEQFRERRGRLDIVLLDLMLPKVDGVEVARTIRSEDPQLPIVICSAVLNRSVQDRLLGLSIQGCLDKPITADRLKNALTEHIAVGDDRLTDRQE